MALADDDGHLSPRAGAGAGRSRRAQGAGMDDAKPRDAGPAELAAARFLIGREPGRPVLVVAPFSLHDAELADLAPGHSPIESLLANGCHDLFLAQWKSATAKTRLNTIDSQFATLNVVVDEIGPPVDLIGLCQGGWLSLAYAARFPNKVRRLVLVGAPIDMAAAPLAFSGLDQSGDRRADRGADSPRRRAGAWARLGRTLAAPAR